MNKDYLKGAIGMTVIAVAIAFFLAYPTNNAEDSIEVASTSATENGEVIKASLDPSENENSQVPVGQEMIDRAREAVDNQETQENVEEAPLEINVIAD
mgnify:FL=1